MEYFGEGVLWRTSNGSYTQRAGGRDNDEEMSKEEVDIIYAQGKCYRGLFRKITYSL